MTFLATLESDVSSVETKVTTFATKLVMNAEALLGAKTGSQKLNLVVTAIEAGLTALGINVSSLGSTLTNVVNAIVALFNATGLLPKPTAPAAS